MNQIYKLKIEKANEYDAVAILKLQKIAYQSEAEIYNDWNIPPLTQTLEELIDEFKDHWILKAIIDSKIVGSVRAFKQDDVIHVGRLMVDPEFQRKGIGKDLLLAIEQHYPRHRFELYTGHLSVDNLRMYQKLGYAIFREQKIHDDLTFIYLFKDS